MRVVEIPISHLGSLIKEFFLEEIQKVDNQDRVTNLLQIVWKSLFPIKVKVASINYSSERSLKTNFLLSLYVILTFLREKKLKNITIIKLLSESVCRSTYLSMHKAYVSFSTFLSLKVNGGVIFVAESHLILDVNHIYPQVHELFKV